jgi:signal transduction histidine kinase/ActR/RegA family two-component response regulator
VAEPVRSNLQAFGIGAAAVAIATLLRYLFIPLVGPTAVPYVFFFAAVTLVGLTGNLAAALFATLLSAIIASWFFVSPPFAFLSDAAVAIPLAAFVATGGAVAALTARLERALRNAEARARVTTERNEALEEERSKLEREARRLALLAEISETGRATPTFDDVVKNASVRVAETIGDGCIIRVLRDGKLGVVGWHHREPEALPMLEAVLLHSDEAAANEYYSKVLKTRRTVVLEDPRRSDLRRTVAPALQPLYDRFEARHAVAVPIQLGEELLGSLSLFRSVGSPYSDADLRASEAVANRIALAIQNARLFEAATREAEDARQARSAAEEASRIKDEFLATLSHELRTPLNAIVGWAHMLRDSSLSEERRRAAVETIVRNAQSQEQLIADILEVQRIMAGKLRLDLQSVDLGNIIRTAAETVQPSADAKNIRLQLLLDLNITPIWGDADRLQQVVWNLLSNAIKFTPHGGLVQVRVHQTDADCEMIVEDNGPGIAPEFLPFVFERFRQADSSSTRTHKWLGLGLAIVRNLVEAHGGSIGVTNVSQADRTGAMFSIRLPRRVSAQIPAASGPDLELAASGAGPAWLGEGPSLAGVQVLVVDDDPDARELVGTILERYGAEVALAASAQEGLNVLTKRVPHVVVTDIEMPQEDGYTFIRRIRSLPAGNGGRVPAAALTAYASVADRMKVLAAGFNMHVPKPVQPAELAMIVASLAGKSVEIGEPVNNSLP